MRKRLLFLIALLCIVGCSSTPSVSPTNVVRKFIAHLENGDIDGLMKLFSRKTLQNNGENVVRRKFKEFSDVIRQVRAEGGNPKIEKIQESIIGDEATVTLVYAAREKDELANLRFTLDKESGEWKVSGMNLMDYPSAATPQQHRTSLWRRTDEQSRDKDV
ncbi:MAG TPA: hypothetical protein VF791_17650 [Pyrinomonadaceae bacterium]